MMPGLQNVTQKPLVTKKVVNVEEEQKQETTETKAYGVKEMSHFVDQ